MGQSPSYQVPRIPEPERYGCLLSCALGCHAVVLTGFLLYGISLFMILLNTSSTPNMPIKLIELGLIVLLWSAVVHLFDRFRWAWRLTIGVYVMALALALFFGRIHWFTVILPFLTLLMANHEFNL